LISNVLEVFAEQVEALSANPDLDPIKKAGAIARVASEELRLRALRFRRAAEARLLFDYGALLEEVIKEVQPQIERKKAALLARESEEALAETSADESNGPSGNPSPAGEVPAGS
jgi:hypothetical protein